MRIFALDLDLLTGYHTPATPFPISDEDAKAQHMTPLAHPLRLAGPLVTTKPLAGGSGVTAQQVLRVLMLYTHCCPPVSQ